MWWRVFRPAVGTAGAALMVHLAFNGRGAWVKAAAAVFAASVPVRRAALVSDRRRARGPGG